jgi:uncharacterized RDD family membrane protein YckC
VIKTCQYCGAVNGEPSDICCFCDAPLGDAGRASRSRRVAAPTEGNLAVEPEWRRELSSRVQNYRARRRGGAVANLQTDLPFDSDFASPLESADSDLKIAQPELPRKIRESRLHRNEKFEISIPHLQSAGGLGDAIGSAPSRPATGLPEAPRYPVASLEERSKAGVADAGLLLFSYGGMLALFTVLGGHIGFNKLDLSVAGATLALFYAQYFALFTVFGGSTPGMMICGMRVVNFEGNMPTSRQMASRSLGYLISAGACFLGFVWALWDDDHLSWQDHLSHTYLTPNKEITPD